MRRIPCTDSAARPSFGPSRRRSRRWTFAWALFPLALGCRERPATRAEPNHGVPPALSATSQREVASAALRVGDRVTLFAAHAEGVPLHDAPHSSRTVGRLPDASIATVTALELGTNWLEIEHEKVGGRSRSWIVRRYLTRPEERAKSGPVLARGSLTADSPAHSRAACLELLSRAKPPRERDRARVATFNVKWFPDGRPGSRAAPEGTDLEWLACLVAHTGAEAVAVQEWKTLPRATASTKALLGHLDRMTGGAWQAHFDSCPNGATQHVGILFDAKRAHGTGPNTLGELNPHGAPCKDSLRPGLALDLDLSNGLAVTLVSVHLKSGMEARSLELRTRSYHTLARLDPPGERPLVVAGDLNSMGCPTCSPALSAGEERARMALEAKKVARTLLGVDPSCSHYYGRDSSLLDGFVVDQELASRARVSASGVCEALACGPQGGEPPEVVKRVSDHCPLVLELGAPLR